MKDKEWLKITRELLDLTGQDVADEMFVTKQTISHIESGEKASKAMMLLYEIILLKHIASLGKDPEEWDKHIEMRKELDSWFRLKE